MCDCSVAVHFKVGRRGAATEAGWGWPPGRAYHDQFTAHCTLHMEPHITINSLHSDCTLHNHACKWVIYHDHITAHCIMTYSAEFWAMFHNQLTAQQLCTAQSCLLHVNNISRSIQCTLHTAPRGRYHNSLARSGCEQCITINSPHSKWYWDSAVCSGGLKYVFQ